MAAPHAWFDRFVTDGVARSLSRSQLLVVLALCRFVGSESLECWPSVYTLVGMCGFSLSTVCRALEGLRARGIVTWREESTRGRPRRVYMLQPLPEIVTDRTVRTPGPLIRNGENKVPAGVTFSHLTTHGTKRLTTTEN
jgi:hypothetical protein